MGLTLKLGRLPTLIYNNVVQFLNSKRAFDFGSSFFFFFGDGDFDLMLKLILWILKTKFDFGLI